MFIEVRSNDKIYVIEIRMGITIGGHYEFTRICQSIR